MRRQSLRQPGQHRSKLRAVSDQRLPRCLRLVLHLWLLLVGAVLASLLVQALIFSQLVEAQSIEAQSISIAPPVAPPVAPPEARPHPLPPSLTQWHSEAGDYFDAIAPTELGYLVWSNFPISVYIQSEPKSAPAASLTQPDLWRSAVEQAIQEWALYLPLAITSDPSTADITILRSAPPMQRPDAAGLPRIRSAETRYEFFVRQQSQPPQVSFFQRLTIYLSPRQTADYTLAAVRHELGHALGIWGHSPNSTDALYFAQVRDPAPISQRDVNTLKRIYQQPTRLGWAVPVSASLGSEASLGRR